MISLCSILCNCQKNLKEQGVFISSNNKNLNIANFDHVYCQIYSDNTASLFITLNEIPNFIVYDERNQISNFSLKVNEEELSLGDVLISTENNNLIIQIETKLKLSHLKTMETVFDKKYVSKKISNEFGHPSGMFSE